MNDFDLVPERNFDWTTRFFCILSVKFYYPTKYKNKNCDLVGLALLYNFAKPTTLLLMLNIKALTITNILNQTNCEPSTNVIEFVSYRSRHSLHRAVLDYANLTYG